MIAETVKHSTPERSLVVAGHVDVDGVADVITTSETGSGGLEK